MQIGQNELSGEIDLKVDFSGFNTKIKVQCFGFFPCQTLFLANFCGHENATNRVGEGFQKKIKI